MMAEAKTNSKIADELFEEICDRGPIIAHPCTIERVCSDDCSRRDEEINKYYYRAAKYAGRISAGDFNGRNKTKLKPIFELDLLDFSKELQTELLSLNGSLDAVITEAVFNLFRARHRRVFFDHIQPFKLKWRLNKSAGRQGGQN
jgi:hypothetical protein